VNLKEIELAIRAEDFKILSVSFILENPAPAKRSINQVFPLPFHAYGKYIAVSSKKSVLLN